MSCQIHIEGRLPRDFGLTKPELRRIAQQFATASSMRVNVPFCDVTIILQQDAASAEVHEAINGVSGATDVVTQPYDALPGEEPGVYGEVYVNTEQARRVGMKRKNWSLRQELLLYVAHGMDHLSGASDLDEKGYRQMRRRELGWLRKLILGVALLVGFRGVADDMPWSARFTGLTVEPVAQFVFPQGGGDMRHLAGAVVRVGGNVTDCFSCFYEVAALENQCGLAIRGNWSLQSWDWFGKMFGYERFDPFVSLGVRGWLPQGDVGPCVGLGFLYYLDNRWAIRCDADVTLGLESEVETIHSVSVGVQYLF